MLEFPKPEFPTPIFACPEVSTDRVKVWIKNDGLTHPVYGGNKVRKMVRILSAAKERGASTILTLGASGSHHVLTAALFARHAGLRCKAVLTAQPATEHVQRTLRAALGQGLEAYPATTPLGFLVAVTRAFRPRDYIVPPGGSSATGALAYADAVDELCADIAAGALPEPDMVVVPFGSGGTAAGLLAGMVRRNLRARLLAVQVIWNPLARWLCLRLANEVLQQLMPDGGFLAFQKRLIVTTEYAGRGYGWSTPEGEAATEIARRFRLDLDPTYTAKAFAAVLDVVRGRLQEPAASIGPLNVVYWHTLSARPLEPLLEGAPSAASLERYRGILKPNGRVPPHRMSRRTTS